MKTKTVHFTVTGSGTFPLDMLRYDRCFPRDSTDCALMDNSDYQRKRTVRLAIDDARRGRSAVTEARWQSFGWTVEVAE